jgi:hypothetical protein
VKTPNRKNRLHSMRHVTLLVKQLFDGVGDRRGLDMAIRIEHRSRITAYSAAVFWNVCVHNVSDSQNVAQTIATANAMRARLDDRSRFNIDDLMMRACYSKSERGCCDTAHGRIENSRDRRNSSRRLRGRDRIASEDDLSCHSKLLAYFSDPGSKQLRQAERGRCRRSVGANRYKTKQKERTVPDARGAG